MVWGPTRKLRITSQPLPMQPVPDGRPRHSQECRQMLGDSLLSRPWKAAEKRWFKNFPPCAHGTPLRATFLRPDLWRQELSQLGWPRSNYEKCRMDRCEGNGRARRPFLLRANRWFDMPVLLVPLNRTCGAGWVPGGVVCASIPSGGMKALRLTSGLMKERRVR
jgi:hypothetical protein